MQILRVKFFVKIIYTNFPTMLQVIPITLSYSPIIFPIANPVNSYKHTHVLFLLLEKSYLAQYILTTTMLIFQ